MKSLSLWFKTALFNFFLVSVLGVLMRYKIAYSLPIVDQKNIQEAHSHFAFYGWITLCIYCFIIWIVREFLPSEKLKKYYYLISANTIFAWMMIPMFLWKGYFVGSVIASAGVLLVSFIFFFLLRKDLKGVRHIAKPWLLGGLFFAMFSSLGVFALSYMMTTGNVNQNIYLASTYFYLHFQYNGFFIFSCIAVLLHHLKTLGAVISEKENRTLFWLMGVGCLVGYGLSVLWWQLPIWLLIIVAIATILQTLGVYKLFEIVKRNWTPLVLNSSPMQRQVLLFVAFAFTVKILLQLGSTIPAVSQLAFGFRNIVIAYLHLVLLMGISVFLVNQILATQLFKISKPLLTSFVVLIIGIFLNELVLGLMGVFSINYIYLPGTPQILVAVSALMMFALLGIWLFLKPARSN